MRLPGRLHSPALFPLSLEIWLARDALEYRAPLSIAHLLIAEFLDPKIGDEQIAGLAQLSVERTFENTQHG